MIVIADSGSSKTHWELLMPDGSSEVLTTDGINPYHQRPRDIDEILKNSKLPTIANTVSDVYFYGAGCNYEELKQKVRDSLASVFFDARIQVDHDLLGAARSLCHREPGIACILGTGSNSCYYDGVNIVENSPSLGYILGDEGSGAYLGQKFIQDYLYGKLPKSINDKFVEEYNLSIYQVLDSVYSKYLPNKFLASFSKFTIKYIKHPYIHGLVYSTFLDFFDNHVRSYEMCEVVETHFTGSIAFYYQDILRRVANDLGIKVGNILQSPLEGLKEYHQPKRS